jgi:hypothetical protein
MRFRIVASHPYDSFVQREEVITHETNDRWLPLLVQAALLAALNYVLSLSLVWLVNIKPIFVLLFISAGVWGAGSAILTAIFGILLWTFANPLGPAPLPVAAAQVCGGVLAALACGISVHLTRNRKGMMLWLLAALGGLMSTGVFFLVVNIVDAWVNQPFWPWFVTGMLTSILPIALHVILFPALVPVVLRLRKLNVGGVGRA